MFCYLQITNNYDLGVGIGLVTLSFILFCLAFYNLCQYSYKSRKLQINIPRMLWFAVILLPFWGLTHIAKMLFGILQYQSFNYHHIFDDNQDNQILIAESSKMFCFLDSVATFAIHCILFIFSYNLLYALISKLARSQSQSSQNSSLINSNLTEKQARRWECFFLLFRIYIALRIVLFAILLALELLQKGSGYDWNQNICTTLNSYLVIESFMCLVLMMLSLFLIHKEQRVLFYGFGDAFVLKTKREIALIIVMCLTRLAFNSIFLLSKLKKKCDKNTNQTYLFNNFDIPFSIWPVGLS